MLAKVNVFDERLDFDIRTLSAVRDRKRDHNAFGRTSSNVALDNYVTYGRLRINIEAQCRNKASRKSREKKPCSAVKLIVKNTFERVTERANAC